MVDYEAGELLLGGELLEGVFAQDCGGGGGGFGELDADLGAGAEVVLQELEELLVGDPPRLLLVDVAEKTVELLICCFDVDERQTVLHHHIELSFIE